MFSFTVNIEGKQISETDQSFPLKEKTAYFRPTKILKTYRPLSDLVEHSQVEGKLFVHFLLFPPVSYLEPGEFVKFGL